MVDGEWIYGAGSQMKSAIAGYLEAVRGIIEAGIGLPGDILIAGVAGEIEIGPVDEFRGCDYAGHGIGTLHLIRHGLAADCCILGEPTAFQVTPWHFGAVWVAFRTRGTMAHTAFQERAVNAIDESMSSTTPSRNGARLSQPQRLRRHEAERNYRRSAAAGHGACRGSQFTATYSWTCGSARP